eukprot:gene7092-5026_t
MGKGRDKRKKHEDPAKAAKRAAKQYHKLSKKEQRESAGDDQTFNNEESIEATLKRIQKAESKIKTVEEVERVAPPSARVNVVLCNHPIRDNELIVFGGEFFNGELTEAYNDVYFYNIKRNTWAKLSTDLNPAPRSSSQGIVYKEFMIIFGGEFVSQTQSQFLHFRDVWRFDSKKSEWCELKGLKGGPSSRSGHRMVLWKRQAVVFGGFYDNAQECHYFNDLFLLSALEGSGKWQNLELSPGSEVPHPRSGHNMAVHGDTLFVYGGYSTQKFNRFKKSEATVHHDLWMAQLPTGEGSTNKVMWVKIRLDGIPPPIRCGVGSAVKDKRMYLFGGVVDLESPGGKMISTFHNDLFVFHMDTKRFYPVVLRRKAIGGDEDNNKNKAKVNDLDAELKALQLHQEEEDDTSSEEGDDIDLLEEEDQEPVKSQEMKESYEVNKLGQIIPHRRMDAAVACIGNQLFVFGGQFESNNKEITMSDLYSLNLNRLETYAVHLSQDLSAAVWMGKESESNAGSWESGSTLVSAAFGYMGYDDDEDEEEDEQYKEMGGTDTTYFTGAPPTGNTDEGNAPEVIPAELHYDATPSLQDLPKSVDALTRTGKKGLKVHKEQLLAQLDSSSAVPTPKPSETFVEFHNRSSSFWEKTVRDSHDGPVKDRRVKKEAVEFSRRRYHEAKELLDQLRIVEEHEREEAKFMKERRLQKEKEWEEWERQQQEFEEEETANQKNSSQSRIHILRRGGSLPQYFLFIESSNMRKQ